MPKDLPDDFDAVELKNDVAAIGTGFEAFKAANDTRLKEIEEKGAADPVTEAKLAKIESDMDKSQERLNAFELAQKHAARRMVDVNGKEIDLEAKAARFGRILPKPIDMDAKGLGEYEAKFGVYLRNGDRMMDATELKALSAGSAADGGYTIHPDLGGSIVQMVRETSAMRAYAAVQTISTGSLKGLIDTDEADSGWVAETAARTDTGTPVLGEWEIPVHEQYANPRATQTVLDDSEINIEAWLAGKVSAKFARTENSAFVNGNGSGKPTGFLSYAGWAAAGVFETGKVEDFKTGVAGDFAAAPDGGDILIQALMGLKGEYRANATWFLNTQTLSKVRRLKDTDGAYVWAMGIQAGQPSTILGQPLATFADMPDPADGSLSIAVGDMKRHYQIVQRAGLRTLRDPFTAKPYVTFYTTARVGGASIDFDAMKRIKFAV